MYTAASVASYESLTDAAQLDAAAAYEDIARQLGSHAKAREFVKKQRAPGTRLARSRVRGLVSRRNDADEQTEQQEADARAQEEVFRLEQWEHGGVQELAVAAPPAVKPRRTHPYVIPPSSKEIVLESAFLAHPHLRFESGLRSVWRPIDEALHRRSVTAPDAAVEALDGDDAAPAVPMTRPPPGLQQNLPSWKPQGVRMSEVVAGLTSTPAGGTLDGAGDGATSAGGALPSGHVGEQPTVFLHGTLNTLRRRSTAVIAAEVEALVAGGGHAAAPRVPRGSRGGDVISDPQLRYLVSATGRATLPPALGGSGFQPQPQWSVPGVSKELTEHMPRQMLHAMHDVLVHKRTSMLSGEEAARVVAGGGPVPKYGRELIPTPVKVVDQFGLVPDFKEVHGIVIIPIKKTLVKTLSNELLCRALACLSSVDLVPVYSVCRKLKFACVGATNLACRELYDRQHGRPKNVWGVYASSGASVAVSVGNGASRWDDAARLYQYNPGEVASSADAKQVTLQQWPPLRGLLFVELQHAAISAACASIPLYVSRRDVALSSVAPPFDPGYRIPTLTTSVATVPTQRPAAADVHKTVTRSSVLKRPMRPLRTAVWEVRAASRVCLSTGLGGHCLLLVGGDLWAWGMANHGQLGVGAARPPPRPLRSGLDLAADHAAAARAARRHPASVPAHPVVDAGLLTDASLSGSVWEDEQGDGALSVGASSVQGDGSNARSGARPGSGRGGHPGGTVAGSGATGVVPGVSAGGERPSASVWTLPEDSADFSVKSLGRGEPRYTIISPTRGVVKASVTVLPGQTHSRVAQRASGTSDSEIAQRRVTIAHDSPQQLAKVSEESESSVKSSARMPQYSYSSAPVNVTALGGNGVVQVSAGTHHSLAVNREGDVFAWGVCKCRSELR
jgi:hypothetical protein